MKKKTQTKRLLLDAIYTFVISAKHIDRFSKNNGVATAENITVKRINLVPEENIHT